jgi:hypothetical protein
VSLSLAFLIARSTISFGILAAFAFCITALSREFASGSGPPSLMAMTMSFQILEKILDILPQRFSFLVFRNSNALPMF